MIFALVINCLCTRILGVFYPNRLLNAAEISQSVDKCGPTCYSVVSNVVPRRRMACKASKYRKNSTKNETRNSSKQLDSGTCRLR